MALTCFENYIGLSLCAGAYESPPSGTYISSLPGLNMESMDKIATQEQVTYQGVWDDVQANALPEFFVDVRAEIGKCYQFNCDCDYDALICENLEVLTQAWKYKLGIWVLMFRLNTNRLNRFTTVDVPQAKELLAFYQASFEQSLSSSVLCMDISSCELCCGGNPQQVTWLP